VARANSVLLRLPPTGGAGESDSAGTAVRVQLISGPTTCFDLGGLRFLTDPAFDPLGEYEDSARVQSKKEGPAVAPGDLGSIDVVLLTDHQHIDRSGRRVIDEARVTLATTAAAAMLGGKCRGLASWEYAEIARADGGTVRITAVPARHRGQVESTTSRATGFVLSGESMPTIYVSGDNDSSAVIDEVIARVRSVAVAILSAWPARADSPTEEDATRSGAFLAEIGRILRAQWVVPVSFQSMESSFDLRESIRDAFEKGGMTEHLALLQPGQEVLIELS
jgi:hypothetical protein